MKELAAASRHLEEEVVVRCDALVGDGDESCQGGGGGSGGSTLRGGAASSSSDGSHAVAGRNTTFIPRRLTATRSRRSELPKGRERAETPTSIYYQYGGLRKGRVQRTMSEFAVAPQSLLTLDSGGGGGGGGTADVRARLCAQLTKLFSHSPTCTRLLARARLRSE